ncbi:hypothetical protein R1sor_001945 [Riccia sorocarpa]|uniref:Myb/SANT-like DNA-binding domain-containing protein n=1 Tax=Riccia sorocarpa TaxID=122646 RepID=A0ABD3GXR5_9MARC
MTGVNMNVESDGPRRPSSNVVDDSQRPLKKQKKRKSPSDSSAPKKAKVEWNKDSEQIFLDIYEESYFNHCNQGNVSQDQWRVITASMNERVKVNIPFEVQSLRNKLDTLVKKYRSEKQKQSQTGAEPSSWEFFEQMHRIRGPSPKEKGIPRACDGGNDVNEGDTNIIDMEDDAIGSENAEAQVPDNIEMEDLSFHDLLFGNEEGFVTPPRDDGTSSRRTAGSNEGGTASAASGNTTTGDGTNAPTPRTKACGQPGVAGKPNKKRKSSSNDDLMTTMRDFVEVIRENNDEKKNQEREKISLMRDLVELRREELALQRQERTNQQMASSSNLPP